MRNTLVTHARLEGVYSVLRQVQAQHNQHETRCIGSGNCCKIGLRISLAECWNIAKQLRREYFIVAESEGTAKAEQWWAELIEDLESAFDIEWDPEVQSTDKHCVFYNSDYGCGIYEFRPMVCRSYGVIAPVEEDVCPRKRMDNGGHLILWDEKIAHTIEEFDAVIEQWGKDNPELDYSMYMPAGVLRFLLGGEELLELIANTDEKYWLAHPGYGHQIHRDHWSQLENGEVLLQIGTKS